MVLRAGQYPGPGPGPGHFSKMMMSATDEAVVALFEQLAPRLESIMDAQARLAQRLDAVVERMDRADAADRLRARLAEQRARAGHVAYYGGAVCTLPDGLPAAVAPAVVVTGGGAPRAVHRLSISVPANMLVPVEELRGEWFCRPRRVVPRLTD